MEKEKAKEERKRKREENKKTKQAATKQTVKRRKHSRIHDNGEESTSELPLQPSPLQSFDTQNLEINSYVIVLYEEECYPGIIEAVTKESVYVNVMTKSKFGNWRWPQTPDKLWYNKETDIMQVINPPQRINSRGIFKVPELVS